MSTINERIAREVMGWLTHENWWLNEEGEAERTINNWKPDTNPADAMAVLKVCAGKRTLAISNTLEWAVTNLDGISASGDTLESAICAFALKLFSPPAQAFNPDDK